MKAMLESILSGANPDQISQSMQKAARMFSQQDGAGNTCLMAAVRHSGTRGGDPEEAEGAALDCCKVVMAHESGNETIDFQNNDGDTALVGAVRENRIKVCEYLLDQGADRTIENKWGMTAAFLANEMNHKECATLCDAPRRAKRATRGESMVSSSSPKPPGPGEPTLGGVAEGEEGAAVPEEGAEPVPAAEGEPAAPEAEAPAPEE